MPTRRHVLALLAAAPIAAGCASDLPDPVAAWRTPGAAETDPRRFALAHAILAPNPHNRQPWLIDLPGDKEIVLYADLERLLPATDPVDRQITLGCGAFIELLDLAARANGHGLEITPWPEGEPQPRLDRRPVAHIAFASNGAGKDALADHILARRTNREHYQAREVANETMDTLARAALSAALSLDASTDASPPLLRIDWTRSPQQLEALRGLAWAGFDREIHTPAAYQESVDLMRIGRAEIARHRDGLVLEGPMIEVAKAIGLLNHETLADLSNPATRDGIEAFEPLAKNAPAYIWMISRENTRAAQLAAGRAYARLNLAAAGAGLAMHPWSQALQEYAEVADLYAEAKTLTGAADGETLQMLARIGYGPVIAPSPRRGLAEHLRA